MLNYSLPPNIQKSPPIKLCQLGNICFVVGVHSSRCGVSSVCVCVCVAFFTSGGDGVKDERSSSDSTQVLLPSRPNKNFTNDCLHERDIKGNRNPVFLIADGGQGVP